MNKTRAGDSGFVLSSLLVGASIFAILLIAAATFYIQQQRANNYLQFQVKKEQLRFAILGQFLTSPDNCKCLFGAASFPTAGVASLPTAATAIGRYPLGNCASGILEPLVDTTGTTGLLLDSVSLNNIVLNGDAYDAHLLVTVSSPKDGVATTKALLDIPVAVFATETAPGTVSFQSCQMMGKTLPYLPQAFAATCRGGPPSSFLPCDEQGRAVCEQMMGSPNYCLTVLYSDIVDGGTANSTIKGYTCAAGLCPNGLNLQ